jgi:RimJ/RimL family protein N-acetyltransferase
MMGSLKLDSIFRSERLLYRGIENNDEDKAFFDQSIQKDPVGFALSDRNLMRPWRRAASDRVFDDILDSHLAVYICLLPMPAFAEDRQAVQTVGPEQQKKAKHEERRPTPIGLLTLDSNGGDDVKYFHHHRTMELYINIAAPFQDQGYGSEAINWALDWGFRHAGLHGVSLAALEYNMRARHLYEKLGFTLEGRFRQEIYLDRRWWDVFLYSMLEDEWEALRGLKSKRKEVLVNREA